LAEVLYTCVYMCVHMCVCGCMGGGVCICMYACIYIIYYKISWYKWNVYIHPIIYWRGYKSCNSCRCMLE
jgi:hypothetical protein